MITKNECQRRGLGLLEQGQISRETGKIQLALSQLLEAQYWFLEAGVMQKAVHCLVDTAICYQLLMQDNYEVGPVFTFYKYAYFATIEQLLSNEKEEYVDESNKANINFLVAKRHMISGEFSLAVRSFKKAIDTLKRSSKGSFQYLDWQTGLAKALYEFGNKWEASEYFGQSITKLAKELSAASKDSKNYGQNGPVYTLTVWLSGAYMRQAECYGLDSLTGQSSLKAAKLLCKDTVTENYLTRRMQIALLEKHGKTFI